MCTTTKPGLCGPGIEPWALCMIVNHLSERAASPSCLLPPPPFQPLVQGTYECGSKIKLTLVKHSEFFFAGGIPIIIVNILSHHLVVWSSKVDCVGNEGMLKGWTSLCCRFILMYLSCCWRSVEFGWQSTCIVPQAPVSRVSDSSCSV